MGYVTNHRGLIKCECTRQGVSNRGFQYLTPDVVKSELFMKRSGWKPVESLESFTPPVAEDKTPISEENGSNWHNLSAVNSKMEFVQNAMDVNQDDVLFTGSVDQCHEYIENNKSKADTAATEVVTELEKGNTKDGEDQAEEKPKRAYNRKATSKEAK